MIAHTECKGVSMDTVRKYCMYSRYKNDFIAHPFSKKVVETFKGPTQNVIASLNLPDWFLPHGDSTWSCKHNTHLSSQQQFIGDDEHFNLFAAIYGR